MDPMTQGLNKSLHLSLVILPLALPRSSRTLLPDFGLTGAARFSPLGLERPLLPRCALQLFSFDSVLNVFGVHSHAPCLSLESSCPALRKPVKGQRHGALSSVFLHYAFCSEALLSTNFFWP